MSQLIKRMNLAAVMLLMFVVPLATSYVVFGALPENFGMFPPTKTTEHAEFSTPLFIMGCGIALVVTGFIALPTLFGFKIDGKRTPFPRWFWIGLVMNVLSWLAMWVQFPFLGSALKFTFVPLWWGLILLLDGIVYQKTNGSSILAKNPIGMVILSIVSAVGWLGFEYFNYFVYENWYYPTNDKFTPWGYFAWYMACYSTVWPSVFEWYSLLSTSKGLTKKYSDGPRLNPSRGTLWGLFALGVGLTCGLVIYQDALFWAVWVGPLLMLTTTLALLGVWTPFSPISKGNWSPIILIAVATVINGICWEGWNFHSQPSNPSLWLYDVPYVNGFKIFEMPFLGFWGYMPFALYIWVFWIGCAKVLGFKSAFDAPGFELAPKEAEVTTASPAEPLGVAAETARRAVSP